MLGAVVGRVTVFGCCHVWSITCLTGLGVQGLASVSCHCCKSMLASHDQLEACADGLQMVLVAHHQY